MHLGFGRPDNNILGACVLTSDQIRLYSRKGQTCGGNWWTMACAGSVPWRKRFRLKEDLGKPVLPYVRFLSVDYRIHFLCAWFSISCRSHSLPHTISLSSFVSLITFLNLNCSYQSKFSIAKSLESLFAAHNVIVLSMKHLKGKRELFLNKFCKKTAEMLPNGPWSRGRGSRVGAGGRRTCHC